MFIKINYSNNTGSKSLSNYALFVEENFSISTIKKNFSNTENSYINEILKKHDLKKKY